MWTEIGSYSYIADEKKMLRCFVFFEE